jgi:glucose/arabinose dehydrogenase
MKTIKPCLLLLLLALVGCSTQSGGVVQPSPTAPLSAPTPNGTGTATPVPAASQPEPTVAQPGPTSVVSPTDAITLPEGFGISVFQGDLNGPRMMALSPDGAIYVAERGTGRIVRLPDADRDGSSDGIQVVADGLDAPTSLAFFNDGSLYVAETTRVLRLAEPDANGVFQSRSTIIDGLPTRGHVTRTVLFSADFRTLYVSVGSSCNVCTEADERRATIMAYTPDGANGQVYARGLRNAVGLALQPDSTTIWATNNGRDMMGDDLPPETVNVISGPALDFGWPRCHAGDVVDPDFGGATGCAGVTPPAVEMQAHSAPLGLAFGAGTTFPAPYNSGLFVAFHGSWNRRTPTGYKLIFVPLNAGEPGPVQDFATGWLKADGTVWGRPVDVLAGADGSLYMSDDAGGAIYRIFTLR